MDFLEHIEGAILVLAPIAGIIALIMNFSWTNLILVCILLVLWKHANGAL